MKCSDIPIQEVLQACVDYHAEIAARRSEIAVRRFCGILNCADATKIVEEMQCEPPLLALQDKYPFKVVIRKMEKLCYQGFIEYGVSITHAWLTPKGVELLESLAVR